VFKQGWLFTVGGLFSFTKRRRVWHRLYGTKLYSMDRPSKELPSCEMTLVCDVASASVLAKPAPNKRDMPYVIVISTTDGKKWELQVSYCQYSPPKPLLSSEQAMRSSRATLQLSDASPLTYSRPSPDSRTPRTPRRRRTRTSWWAGSRQYVAVPRPCAAAWTRVCT
jgi:hypothetical protein